MIEKFLTQDEGKTLEFKENCRPLRQIVRTAVAFANTAGGTIVIGVKDGTKQVVGVADPLVEEEPLANTFAESIRPLLIPDIQIHSWRKSELIVVTVPHTVGPYYVLSEGPVKGVSVRLGSTNRRAGPELIAAIQRLARNTFFDEQPCSEMSSDDIDVRAASEFFAAVSRPLTPSKQRSLGLVVGQGAKRSLSSLRTQTGSRQKMILFSVQDPTCLRLRRTQTGDARKQVSWLTPDLPAASRDEAQAGMLYRQVQFLVDESDWAQQGQEVEAPREPEERGV